VAQHRHGKGRIHGLVAAGKARQRQVELALFIPVTKPPLANNRIPTAAARKPWSAGIVSNLADPAANGGRVELGD
jgi:hypothetical protein